MYPASDPHRRAQQHRTTPEECYPRAGRYATLCAAAAAVFCAAGLYIAFGVAPGIVDQGRHNLIVFIHIPSGWMSVLIYLATTIASVLGRPGDRPVASMFASALAPTGALFAFLSLWSGSLWMKPNWGVWWIWEPRQTSQLLLLFLFLGYIALQEATDDRRRADRLCGILAMAGMFALPLLYFSVRWWSAREGTLDLGLAVERNMDGALLCGLLAMTAGLFAYSCAVALTRLRIVILERERDSEWISRSFRVRR